MLITKIILQFVLDYLIIYNKNIWTKTLINLGQKNFRKLRKKPIFQGSVNKLDLNIYYFKNNI